MDAFDDLPVGSLSDGRVARGVICAKLMQMIEQPDCTGH